MLETYKAQDIRLLDVRGRCSFTDYLIIASGTSDRHVQGIAEHISTDLQQQGERCLGKEGLQGGQWALLDYGSVVLHVFHPYSRELYGLEALWQPAVSNPAPGSNPPSKSQPFGYDVHVSSIM